MNYPSYFRTLSCREGKKKREKFRFPSHNSVILNVVLKSNQQVFPIWLVKSRLGSRSKRDVGNRVADTFLQVRSHAIYYKLQKIQIDY